MSISLEKLQRLRMQAGRAAPRNDAPAPAEPRVPVAVAETSLPALRRMLGLRGRSAPAPVSPMQVIGRSVDRALPGDEIARGLLYLEDVLPFESVPRELDGTFARCGPLPTQHMLFFDTETTGLSGGTGTRAFMVGASDFVPEGLRVRTLMTTHLSAEPAMLAEFARWLTPETHLVSYNGRCYDAPLLATRYRLARLGTPLAGLAHVDLLFPTRRRYRGVWENCRLGTIERNALGIVREDDLPGSEAPGAWRTYLRGGSAELLRRVLQHNFQDVVTLARLVLHLAETPPASAAQADAGRDALPLLEGCDAGAR